MILRIKLSLILLLSIVIFFQNTLANVNFSGFFEVDHISYRKNINNKINSRNQMIFQPEVTGSINDNKFFVATEIRQDLSDKNRNRVYFQEAYIKRSFGDMDIKLGKQIINWGKADVINPTNNINANDYTDILDTKQIGSYALSNRYFLNDWIFEGIFIPIFEVSRVPFQLDSRWYMELASVNLAALGNPKYSLTPLSPIIPHNDSRGSQFAFQISNSINGWDIFLNYYQGYQHFATYDYKINVITIDSINIALQPKYADIKILGADFVTYFYKFGIRAEGAYFIPDKINVDNPYAQYVVGIDRNITFSEYNSLFILIQWIHEITEKDIKYSHFDLNHLFQKSLAAKLELNLGLTWKISLQGLYNFHSKDYYMQPSINYNLGSGLNLELTYDYLGGKEGGFFSAFKNNDRIQITSKYSF